METESALWVPLVDTTTGRAYCGHVQTAATGRRDRFSFVGWSLLYWLGKLLTWPAEKTVETYLYVFNRDIRPGRHEQCATVGREKMHRAVLLLGMVLMGILAVLLFPFDRLKRTTPAVAVVSEDSHSDRSANNLANPTKRAKFLIKELQLGKDDIVCFQECFDWSATKMIIHALGSEQRARKQRLHSEESDDMAAHLGSVDVEQDGVLGKEKPVYPWVVADCDPRSYRLNSGLAIISRYPLANPAFVRYTNRVGEDVMAGKGVLGCTVILGTSPEGRSLKLTVFTSHLQAGSAPPKDIVHLQQMQTMIAFIRYYNFKHIDKQNDIWVGSVLMGDFNIAPINGDPAWWGGGELTWDREWKPMKELFNTHDIRNWFYEDTDDGEVRSHNQALILKFQDLFAERLRELVKEMELDHTFLTAEKREGLNRVRIDIITLLNRLTAWVGDREQKRECKLQKADSCPQPSKAKGKRKDKPRMKRVKEDQLIQTSDNEVSESSSLISENEVSDGDDDEAVSEEEDLMTILFDELARQAGVVTGWQGCQEWFKNKRRQMHGQNSSSSEGSGEESVETDDKKVRRMAKLLRDLKAIPSEPVIEIFNVERRGIDTIQHGRSIPLGKWGRPKLLGDRRVEYLIPGTSIEKGIYEGKYPDEVDFNDIDHIWGLAQWRGLAPRMENLRTRIVDYYPFFYTDHLGKRLEFEVALQD